MRIRLLQTLGLTELRARDVDAMEDVGRGDVDGHRLLQDILEAAKPNLLLVTTLIGKLGSVALMIGFLTLAFFPYVTSNAVPSASGDWTEEERRQARLLGQDDETERGGNVIGLPSPNGTSQHNPYGDVFTSPEGKTVVFLRAKPAEVVIYDLKSASEIYTQKIRAGIRGVEAAWKSESIVTIFVDPSLDEPRTITLPRGRLTATFR